MPPGTSLKPSNPYAIVKSETPNLSYLPLNTQLPTLRLGNSLTRNIHHVSKSPIIPLQLSDPLQHISTLLSCHYDPVSLIPLDTLNSLNMMNRNLLSMIVKPVNQISQCLIRDLYSSLMSRLRDIISYHWVSNSINPQLGLSYPSRSPLDQ
ncbi:hypothetical protein Tco_1013197 [Tanacetum coccineum]